MSVGIGVAPYQLIGCQGVHVELDLSVDTITDRFVGAFGYRHHRVLGYQFHVGIEFYAELLFYSGEVKIITLETPAAGTYIYVWEQHRVAVGEFYLIFLSCRIQSGAVFIEVHYAFLIDVEVSFGYGIVPWMFVVIMALDAGDGLLPSYPVFVLSATAGSKKKNWKNKNKRLLS